jgi:hypothetical protein
MVKGYVFCKVLLTLRSTLCGIFNLTYGTFQVKIEGCTGFYKTMNGRNQVAAVVFLWHITDITSMDITGLALPDFLHKHSIFNPCFTEF